MVGVALMGGSSRATPKKEPHEVRLLRQALKKGRSFEVAKANRRLKQAQQLEQEEGPLEEEVKQDERDGEGGARARMPRRGAPTSAKRAAQLAALKALDIERALRQICAQLGLEAPALGALANPSAGNAPGTLPEGSLSIRDGSDDLWAVQRVLAARCVQELVHKTHLVQNARANKPSGGAASEHAEHEAETIPDVPSTGFASDRKSGMEEGNGPPDSSQRSKRQLSKPQGRQSKAPKHKAKNRLGQRSRRRLLEEVWTAHSRGSAGNWRESHGPGHQQRGFSTGARQVKGQSTAVAGKARSPLDRISNAGSVIQDKKGSDSRGLGVGAETKSAELHPSWSARAALAKKLMLPGAGKKITFSDED